MVSELAPQPGQASRGVRSGGNSVRAPRPTWPPSLAWEVSPVWWLTRRRAGRRNPGLFVPSEVGPSTQPGPMEARLRFRTAAFPDSCRSFRTL